MPILPMSAVSTVKKRDDYTNQMPLSAGELEQKRRLYTAPRPSATNVMRAILQGASNNPDAIAAARHRIKSKADMNLKNRQDQMQNQFNETSADIENKNKELDDLTDQKIIEEHGTDLDNPNLTTYSKIQGLQKVDVPEFNPTTSADPQDIRSALYQNEGGFIGRGMSALDDLAFRRAGGERLVTDEINRVGQTLEENRQRLGSDLAAKAQAYNEKLASRQSKAKEIIDELNQNAALKRAERDKPKEEPVNEQPEQEPKVPEAIRRRMGPIPPPMIPSPHDRKLPGDPGYDPFAELKEVGQKIGSSIKRPFEKFSEKSRKMRRSLGL